MAEKTVLKFPSPSGAYLIYRNNSKTCIDYVRDGIVSVPYWGLFNLTITDTSCGEFGARYRFPPLYVDYLIEHKQNIRDIAEGLNMFPSPNGGQ